VVRTELVRHITNSVIKYITNAMSIDVEDGAITQMYLATSPEVEDQDIKGKYYVPYGVEATPIGHATSQKNQTELWDFSEKILHEKVPGYAGAGI
jgi:hypothetical protein